MYPATYSFWDSSTFGWGCISWAGSSQVFVAGSNQPGRGSWVAWKEGDRGVFTYSPLKATLTLQLQREGGVREFSINNCCLPDGAFIHFYFFNNGTKVRFSRAV